MFGWVLPLMGVFIEALILYRCVHTGAVRKYPVFLTYVGCVLAVDIYRDLVYLLHGPSYRELYFATEYLTLLVGYGVILEVTRKALESYAGAERFSRYLVIGIFAAIFAYVGFEAATANGWSPAGSLRELERDLRAVQALVIASVLAVVLYYRIHIGRNLGGIMLGYGLYTGSTVVTLALRSYAGSFAVPATIAIQRYSYLLSLAIWVLALWSCEPNPVPDASMRLEVDYEALVGRTRGMLGTMRSLLERSARS